MLKPFTLALPLILAVAGCKVFPPLPDDTNTQEWDGSTLPHERDGNTLTAGIAIDRCPDTINGDPTFMKEGTWYNLPLGHGKYSNRCEDAPQPDMPMAERGINYGSPDPQINQPHQYLHVYSLLDPKDYPGAPEPSGLAILHAPGGAFAGSNMYVDQASALLQHWMDQGHVVFVINYMDIITASGGQAGIRNGTWPQNIHDMQWAIAWANQPAQKAHYKYGKLVVSGGSAGGVLAAVAGTRHDHRPANMPDDPVLYNTRPDGVIVGAAPLDIINLGDHPMPAEPPVGVLLEEWPADWEAGQRVQRIAFVNLWGRNWEDRDQVTLSQKQGMDAAHWVTPDDPPIFMTSGVADSIALPADNANKLYDKYLEVFPNPYLSGPDDPWAPIWPTVMAYNEVLTGPGTMRHNLGYGYARNMAALDWFLGEILKECPEPGYLTPPC